MKQFIDPFLLRAKFVPDFNLIDMVFCLILYLDFLLKIKYSQEFLKWQYGLTKFHKFALSVNLEIIFLNLFLKPTYDIV